MPCSSLDLPRLAHAAGAALDRRAVRVLGVGHGERDHLDAVAVARVVLADLVARRQRAGQHDPDAPLLEHERDAVAHARLEPGVGDLLEAERLAVEVGRLGGVADPQLDVVDAVQRHEVLGCRPRSGYGLRAHLSPPGVLEVVGFMIALSRAASQCRCVAFVYPYGALMDEIDRQIVALLRQDARRSFQSIGLRVVAERAGGQAARRQARGGGRGARLHGARRPRPLRLGHARDRVALLRGPDGGRGGARRGRAPPRGGGRVHRRRRGQRGAARACARHIPPRGGARADPRPGGRPPDADADRALDAVRAALRRAQA